MGHREDLLAGAKRCLLSKGYVRTTARDIVAESGTNLASIGYHYGSKEALMNQAFFAAIEEWGDELEETMKGREVSPDADFLQRFEALWDAIIGLYAKHRMMWTAHYEVIAQLDRYPELAKIMKEMQQEGREGIAELFESVNPATDKATRDAVTVFYQSLLAGMMALLIVSPEDAPSGRELALALRTIAEGVSAG
jgi:AcrR family transcriptional regulator